MSTYTWSDLRQLRAAGQRPRLPLIVTTNSHRCRELADAGHMVIVHYAGERFAAELLVGLEVECWLENCAQASSVAQLVRDRGISVRAFRVWCGCEQELMTLWHHDCEHCAAELNSWDRLVERRKPTQELSHA